MAAQWPGRSYCRRIRASKSRWGGLQDECQRWTQKPPANHKCHAERRRVVFVGASRWGEPLWLAFEDLRQNDLPVSLHERSRAVKQRERRARVSSERVSHWLEGALGVRSAVEPGLVELGRLSSKELRSPASDYSIPRSPTPRAA